MTRLLNFLELKREGFLYFGMKEREGLYSNDEGNINRRPFNEG